MSKPIIKSVFETLGEQVKDTAKGIATAPIDIVKTALGADPLETSPQSSSTQSQNPNPNQPPDNLIAQKKQELEESQKQIQRHRDMLSEEVKYYNETEAEAKQAEKVSEVEEEKEEQQRIIQIRHQQAKDAVLQPASTNAGQLGPLGTAVKKKKGTIESDRLKD